MVTWPWTNFQNRLVKFKDFLSILKDLVCFPHFQRIWILKIEFKHFQGLLKHAMKPAFISKDSISETWRRGPTGDQLTKVYVDNSH